MRLEWLRLLRAETERFWYHGNLLFLGLSRLAPPNTRLFSLCLLRAHADQEMGEFRT